MAGAYIPLSNEDVVVSTDSVTSAMWSDNNPTLLNYFTSSAQLASAVAPYYYTVYQTASTETTAEIQFDIAYCDEVGSGSVDLNPLVTGVSPTKINYGQYRNLVLGDENASFIFGNHTSSIFYVLNLERARYKQQILPGTWTLMLSGSTAGTPSQKVSLTDDSLINPVTSFTDAGRVYNIISGSAGVLPVASNQTDANGWTIDSGSYGWMLPDVNLLILNGDALDATWALGGIALATVRQSSTADNNPLLIFNALNSGGGNINSPNPGDNGGLGTGFTMNSQENLSSDFIFCRARNSQVNYSSNPSFISSSTGAIIYDTFIENPTTFITTVGLYNESQELLATAKLSRPLEKDFTKELLVRVKLDF